MNDIILTNLVISPETCLVDEEVNISVIATNQGNVAATRTIKMEYTKEVTMMVILSGSVSKQATAGEVVTITVTLPDQSTEQVTANTLGDKSFSAEYTNIPGNYKAKARIEADALYQAAESSEVSFAIGKEPRTITLIVT